jgi:sugar O-acyltransferase (sialic acid O-acetyltransferase NeuD family)
VLESKNIYILGYSGHAYVVIDVALSNNFVIKGYFDNTKSKINPYNLDYLGLETKVDIKEIIKSDFVFPAIGDIKTRKNVISFIEKNNLNQTKLIHESASVSHLALVKPSTVIAPNSTVNSMAKIGKGCIINSGAIVEHECQIGDFTHIAPGAILAGNVIVGNEVFIGSNVIIKQGIEIGNNSIIGAGTVVINKIPSNQTWVGNPARRIR